MCKKYKVLFIYTCDLSQSSGGTTGTQKALKFFEENYQTEKYYINRSFSKKEIFINSLCGYLKSNRKSEKQLCQLLREKSFDILFFDDSVNGKIIKAVKRKFPSIFIVVNFHNDETKYYKDIYISKGVLYFPLYIASKTNQKNALEYSNYRIYITDVDKKSIGETSDNYTIIPALLTDSFDLKKSRNADYYLFFGFSFYANDEAVRYIINEIAPKVSKRIVIAGKGMDTTFKYIDIPPNVKIIGYVDNLNSLFENAIAFICPIFSGSGMKVKIVDALMRGKTVICTDFAAIGYDKQKEVFKICNTAQQFIDVINNQDIQSYNEYARQLFCDKYDAKKLQEYYKDIHSAYLKYKSENK